MIETPHITETEDLHYAALHLTVRREQMRTVMGPGIREVYSAVAAQGVTPTGPWFTHHLKRPGVVFDFEICVPVSRPIELSGRVEPRIWPAMKVARTIYHGDYEQGEHEGLAGAWPKFMAWIAEMRFNSTDDLWERYIVGPETSSNPADWRTELNRALID